MTGRSCHAIEISPAYVDVGVQRWQIFHRAGGETLDNDGRTFAEIAGGARQCVSEVPEPEKPRRAGRGF